MNAARRIPLTLYTDGRSVFTNHRTTEQLTIVQQLAGIDPRETQFNRALGQLGVSISIAASPEARKHIEWLWGTL